MAYSDLLYSDTVLIYYRELYGRRFPMMALARRCHTICVEFLQALKIDERDLKV